MNEPVGNYTFRQTFTLTSSAGAMLTGGFAADDHACVTLNGGSAQCTPGGYAAIQYTPFEFTTGFQAGTNTLDFVVNNSVGGPTGLEVVVNIEKKLYSFGHGSTGPIPRLVSSAMPPATSTARLTMAVFTAQAQYSS